MPYPPAEKVRILQSFIDSLAAHMYDLAALRYFGEFAALNFPRESYL